MADTIDELLSELTLAGTADHPRPDRIPEALRELLERPSAALCKAAEELPATSFTSVLFAMAANCEWDGAEDMARALRLIAQRLACYEATQL